MQELFPGSGVKVRTMQLTHAIRAAKIGTHLIRNLMDVFWTKDGLASSSVGSAGKFKQWDTSTVKAIEGESI